MVLVMLSVSITLGLALTRRTPSVKLLAVGAVLAQVCWHGLLFTTTTCAGAFSDCRSISAQAVMLAGHLGVVAVTVAVCCGVDRALVDCGYLLAEGLRAAFTEPRSTVVPTLWVHLLTVAGVATRTSLITLGPSAPRGPPSESARAALV
ncbi:MAG TPA: hypothetical protein DEQ43_13145 [Nocardioides bacterium]|nr:hypothetical protein [Nocardioides sp.]